MREAPIRDLLERAKCLQSHLANPLELLTGRLIWRTLHIRQLKHREAEPLPMLTQPERAPAVPTPPLLLALSCLLFLLLMKLSTS